MEFKQDLILYCRMFNSSVERATNEVKDAVNFLRSKRRGLIAVRREILTRVAEDRVDAPPTYRTNSSSGVDGISNQLADVNITMPRGPGELPPPAYDIPSAPRDGPRYPPPAGPPPNHDPSQSRRGSEIPPASPTLPSMPTSGAMPTMYNPPPGPPPGHEPRPSTANSMFNRTLSASSSGRSRSLSPHPRSPSGSARASPLSSPHAWDKPLPASPIHPQSPLLDRGSPSFQATRLRSRSPSPFSGSPRSPSSPGTSQLYVAPNMQFPEPLFTQNAPHGLSDQLPSPGLNLGSPWRIEVVNGGGGPPNQSDNDSRFTLPPQMPSANPFLDFVSTPVADENVREPSGTLGTSTTGAEQPQRRTETSAEQQGQEDLVNTRSRSATSKNPFRQPLSS